MLSHIYILVFVSVFCIVFYFFLNYDKRVHLPKDIKLEASPLRPRQAFFLARLLKPLNNIFLAKHNEAIRQKLFGAELSQLLPEEFLLIKEVIALALPITVYIIFSGNIEPIWLAVAAAAGFILPDLYLSERLRRRKSLIIRQLPSVLDMTFLVVSAGLDFISGLRWIVRHSEPGALINDLNVVIQEINVGKSREEALKAMAKRLNLPEISSMVRTIVQGDKMGTPISEIIKILSEDMRRQRFERGQRVALKAPIKILFPLVVFILPTIGIIVGAPILMQFIQGGMVGLK